MATPPDPRYIELARCVGETLAREGIDHAFSRWLAREHPDAYHRAVVDYNIAIEGVHFRKGSLLEYNGVYLTELPSPAKAYQDAYEKIKMRTRAARWAADGASTRVVSRRRPGRCCQR